MKTLLTLLLGAGLLAPAGCATEPSDPQATASTTEGTLAQIYYWRAKPGKFDEYTRYIREHAEPIDAEAQRQGAFVSVTTYMTRDSLSPWSHMRVFILRDSAQLMGLSDALGAAGIALEPDSAQRQQTREYSSGLRNGVGSATVSILR